MNEFTIHLLPYFALRFWSRIWWPKFIGGRWIYEPGRIKDRNLLDGWEERQDSFLSRHKAKRLMSFCCFNQIRARWSPIFVVSSTWSWRRIRLYRRGMWGTHVKQIISIFHQDFNGSRLRCSLRSLLYLPILRFSPFWAYRAFEAWILIFRFLEIANSYIRFKIYIYNSKYIYQNIYSISLPHNHWIHKYKITTYEKLGRNCF